MNGRFKDILTCDQPRPWLAVCAAAVLLCSTAGGQSTGTTDALIVGQSAVEKASPLVLSNGQGRVQATVHRDDLAEERVTVTVGSSTVVDINVPVKRVEVASPEIAGVTVLSPKQILVSAYKVGITQIILWSESEDRLLFAVEVEPNIAQIREAIAKLVPDAKVELRVVNGSVVVSGRVSNVDDAARITDLCRISGAKVQNQMIVAGEQQVLLRCTVAEVSKTAIRELGIDAWASFEANPAQTVREMIGLTDPSALLPSRNYVTGTSNFFGNRFLFGSTEQGAGFAISSKSLQMEMFVRALKRNGLMRILAEPNLVALTGQKAEFLAGGQFPVPVPQRDNVTIEWKDYGIKLAFVPTVIGQQMIRLSVAPEVSELDYTNAVTLESYVVPGVSQRRTMTTIELASGSTIAIAGLLREQIRGEVNKFPALGELPVLGALFRSVNYQRDLTELIILVTPELVSGMMPDQVPGVPGKDVQDVSDWNLFGLGLLEGKPMPQDKEREGALLTEQAPHVRKFASPPDQMSIHGPWGAADPSEAVVNR
ncbi:MAG TPA: type II and III secretion system protein family protein [Phycisphaerae bacterium]|nr:type II and III secretion system protein family protein [Phycisphaerae bacterium]HRR83630.1 type II and III secretion system protein family protein [Phycisphaerae bacterium]